MITDLGVTLQSRPSKTGIKSPGGVEISVLGWKEFKLVVVVVVWGVQIVQWVEQIPHIPTLQSSVVGVAWILQMFLSN